MINDWENIIAYLEEFKQSEGFSNNFGLFQIHLGGVWCKISRKFGNCYTQTKL